MESTTPNFADREAWLTAALALFETDVLLARAGKTFPAPYRVSCGYPRGCRGSSKRRGETYPPEASADGRAEVFASPEIDDPGEALSIIWAQGIRVALRGIQGTGDTVRAMARACGFPAASGDEMLSPDTGDAQFAAHLAILGPYPHAKLDAGAGRKQDYNRQLLVVCGTCDFRFRASRKQLSRVSFGAAACPCCDARGKLSEQSPTE